MTRTGLTDEFLHQEADDRSKVLIACAGYVFYVINPILVGGPQLQNDERHS